ncbi:MAG: hypothetical protein M3422_01290, partial [Actinomycetota bacterium]|nr:hypothetical protein [Actinomycetota bacterium]
MTGPATREGTAPSRHKPTMGLVRDVYSPSILSGSRGVTGPDPRDGAPSTPHEPSTALDVSSPGSPPGSGGIASPLPRMHPDA